METYMKNIYLLGCISALVACGGAEHIDTWVKEKSATQVTVAIHISLMDHPEETHILGYNNMQLLANATCAEFGKNSAKYSGKAVVKTLGNAYDTWIERTYRCV
jgi:hypothetical protein